MDLPFLLETPLERNISSDLEWFKGMMWGFARPGHPEGTVGLHVKEVLKNIDALNVDADTRRDLRLIALLHDAFKYQIDPSKNRTPTYHHGYLARKFAEKYISDMNVIDSIELHDDAFRAWARGQRYGKWMESEVLARKLLKRLKNVQLYLLFYKCDNLTGDKSQEGYEWFSKFLSNHDANFVSKHS